MSRELGHDELHPCECDDAYTVLSNEEYEHVKRNYYEVTTYYFCRRCDCDWRIVTWCVGQDSTIHIDTEPWSSEEEE